MAMRAELNLACGQEKVKIFTTKNFLFKFYALYFHSILYIKLHAHGKHRTILKFLTSTSKNSCIITMLGFSNLVIN